MQMKSLVNHQKMNLNNSIIIGSSAFRFYFRDFRRPQDIDLYVNSDWENPFSDFKTHGANRLFANNFEIKVIREDFFSESDLTILSDKNTDTLETEIGHIRVCSLELNCAIKIASSEHKNPKHKEDLVFLNRKLDLQKIENKYKSFIEQRKQEIFGRRLQKDFFNRFKIVRFLEHDYIHILAARSMYGSKPILEEIVRQETEVSRELFLSLPYKKQLRALLEESVVLALERNILIPSNDLFSNPRIFIYAIHQLNRLAGRYQTVKDHPEWLIKWTNDNYDSIIEELKSLEDTTFDSVLSNTFSRIKNKTALRIS